VIGELTVVVENMNQGPLKLMGDLDGKSGRVEVGEKDTVPQRSLLSQPAGLHLLILFGRWPRGDKHPHLMASGDQPTVNLVHVVLGARIMGGRVAVED
jgi:hypothetical protein